MSGSRSLNGHSGRCGCAGQILSLSPPVARSGALRPGERDLHLTARPLFSPVKQGKAQRLFTAVRTSGSSRNISGRRCKARLTKSRIIASALVVRADRTGSVVVFLGSRRGCRQLADYLSGAYPSMSQRLFRKRGPKPSPLVLGALSYGFLRGILDISMNTGIYCVRRRRQAVRTDHHRMIRSDHRSPKRTP